MHELDDYEQKLLESWEDVYKKGQLTLMIMLALKDGPKHMAAIKDYIHATTRGTLTADDQSMYRALRRYHDAEMVAYDQEPGNGPDRKVYRLTPIGFNVLDAFTQRNITDIYLQPAVRRLIERKSL